MKLTKKSKIISLILFLIVSVILFFILFIPGKNTSTEYLFTFVKRGNIESIISCSGTINPVKEVLVGTQVSGTIERVYVDFNDKVKEGQILAVLDTSLLRMAADEAQGNVLKAEAQLEEAQENYNRSKMLFEKELLSNSEFQTVKTSLKNAQAGMIVAKSALERAKRNLNYAVIRAPISGTVTARYVEAGQTVAASFSTPTLFIIAQDLSKIEIKVSVDESDIGQIKEGQSVRFTVQAYPEKKFQGKVKQVRIQPTITANVVTYTVIVSAENRDNLLLPGMTATVDFIIEYKANVLIIPNAALRFQPTEQEMMEVQKRMHSSAPPVGIDSINNEGELKRLWYLDNDGKLAFIPVKVGISDGTNSEIYGNISEGFKVIIGKKSGSINNNRGKSKSNSGGPPPPMM